MTDTTDTCPATNRDGDPCGLSAGWGTENDSGPCKFHGGAGGDTGDPGGAPSDNQNAKRHGAFSDHFRSDLTDDEKRALEALVAHLDSIDDERTLAAEVAAEALLKYKRATDDRFLREARQWMSDFNLMPNEDELNIGGTDGGALEVVVERNQYDGDE